MSISMKNTVTLVTGMSQLGENAVVLNPLRKLQDFLDYVKITDFEKFKSEFPTILENSDHESDLDFNQSWPTIIEKSQIIALNFSLIDINDISLNYCINTINSRYQEILNIQSNQDSYNFDSLNIKLLIIRSNFERMASILPKTHSNHFNYF